MQDIQYQGGEHAVLLIHGLSGNPLEMSYVAKVLHKGSFTMFAPHLETCGFFREQIARAAAGASGGKVMPFRSAGMAELMSANPVSPVATEIQEMMVKAFGLSPDAVRPDAQLEQLGVDSLAAIEFIFELEDHFKIRLADERAPIKTVQDVIDIVEKARATQAPGA